MKVLLINPPYELGRYLGTHLKRIGWVLPPIGLLYVAAFLEREGVDVQVYDAQTERRPLLDVLAGFRPAVVGITATTALVYSAIESARLAKVTLPGVVVVAGGVHPTVLPDEMLKDPNIDLVVRGEGERTMLEIVRAVESGGSLDGIQGLSYRHEGRVIHNPSRGITEDLSTLPFPARHLVDSTQWRMSPDWNLRRPFDVIFTVRGCPYRCIFCANQMVSGGRYRASNLDHVMAEIKLLRDTYKIRSLVIGDDSFVVSKARALEFCERYIANGFHKEIPWQASTRVDSVNLEVLTAMKAAGCYMLSFGVESGVPRLLEVLDKKITLDQTREAVRLTRQVGIKTRGTVILGIPTETIAESEETIAFVRTLPLDQVRFSLATPFPGTELYRMAVAEGGLDITDWTSLSLMAGYRKGTLAYTPVGRDADELTRLQRRANLEFFLRPRIAWGYVTRVRSFGDILEYGRGFLGLLKASWSAD